MGKCTQSNLPTLKDIIKVEYLDKDGKSVNGGKDGKK
jgi:hypothetical protein